MFDSHAHLSSSEILPHIEDVMERASVANVTHMLNICTDAQTLQDGLALQKKYPHILNAGATTPHDVETEGEKNFPLFENAARTKQLVAVGETGLDYHYKHSPLALQKHFLIRYLHLAAECQLPVIFHCREAFSDLFSIVDLEYPKKAPAILHCFTGTVLEAEEVLKRGWFLSLSGIVTFKKSEVLREVAKMVPLSQLLIETDSPYLAPQSKRGKQNEPSFLQETGECIAKVKGVAPQDVFQATTDNARRLFKEDGLKTEILENKSTGQK
jgi:TatD DNase family protein